MDIIYDLEGYGSQVEVYDPWVDSNIAKNEYKIKMVDEPKSNKYDAIVIAVAHNKFKELGAKKISSFATKINVIYDLKYLFEKEYSSLRL
jgi:UDP-N-acetyl-D-galactosamine dehydrogenase